MIFFKIQICVLIIFEVEEKGDLNPKATNLKVGKERNGEKNKLCSKTKRSLLSSESKALDPEKKYILFVCVQVVHTFFLYW